MGFVCCADKDVKLLNFEYHNEPVNLDRVAVVRKTERTLPVKARMGRPIVAYIIEFINEQKQTICEWVLPTKESRDTTYDNLTFGMSVINT